MNENICTAIDQVIFYFLKLSKTSILDFVVPSKKYADFCFTLSCSWGICVFSGRHSLLGSVWTIAPVLFNNLQLIKDKSEDIAYFISPYFQLFGGAFAFAQSTHIPKLTYTSDECIGQCTHLHFNLIFIFCQCILSQ